MFKRAASLPIDNRNLLNNIPAGFVSFTCKKNFSLDAMIYSAWGFYLILSLKNEKLLGLIHKIRDVIFSF